MVTQDVRARCQQVDEYEAGTVVFPELSSLPR